ncbi:transposase [uncultured Ruegeria sp.]|uniref:transposase n=1 Tax=uncultured Ruegeria sp. TaxID=259304 RepID=UPI00261C577E|nr:transposase [uncultured Ruegeria sp.]
MLGPRQEVQAALFYEFSLEDHVPQDHLLRSIDRFVDLGSIRSHLADFYSHTGRPSIDPELLIADTAYGSGPMLDWLVKHKIAPHIPVIDKAGRTDGTWSRADFEWDAANNQYICPEGDALKQFRHNYSDPNRDPTGKGVAKYQALKHTCQACPSKPKCCPNADARKITREEHEDARRVARDIAKTEQYEISMKLQKKVEMLFAHLKRILGLGRLRLRGPCAANDEFLLAATVQNLRKLTKIFPAPQQTRKV